MGLDARTRSSTYGKFAEILGDDDANALMSQFPSVEADELVTNSSYGPSWSSSFTVRRSGSAVCSSLRRR